MGVVNITPDSFSDGGRYATTEAAVEHALELVAAGADLLDIGGESTRPGAPPVSADEEMARVLPVIEALRARVPTPLSIDTTKSAVADAACRLGAAMINDISGLTFDPAIATVAAEHSAALCVMHIRGTPRTMQTDPRYEDVVGEVVDFLQRAVKDALAAGVRPDGLCVDPGIGFGKRLEHNLALINGIGVVAERTRRPVLVGVSRKSFIGTITGKPVRERVFGTAAAVTISVLRGGHIMRVHDVAEMADVVRIADALVRA